MKLELMTAVWGEKHIDMFQKAALKSLSFTRNKKALYENESTWTIFSEDKFFDHLRKIVDAYLPEFQLELVSTRKLMAYLDMPQSAAVMMMEKCIKSNAKLLMVPPDTIFGDGSVHGLLRAGRERFTCVVVPHARVFPEMLKEITGPSISNAELVRLAWLKNEDGSYRYLHRAWSEADVDYPVRNSFVSGVVWQKVSHNLYSVLHRLPTVYLADFTEEDLQYFKVAISFGVWDHTWPGDVLIPRGRQRFIGSSDMAFLLEITDPDKNVPPVMNGDPDSFWQNHPHNEVNKMFISSFRAE